MRGVLTFLLFLAVAAVPAGAQEALPLPSAPADEAASAEPALPIPLRSPDADIRARLLELYRGIDGLGEIRVVVDGGVVTLAGTVLDAEARAQAEDIAGRLDGVVSVESNLQTEHRVERRLGPLVAQAEAIGVRFLELLPLLAVALIVFAAFWLAGVLFTRWTNLFRRLVANPFIEALLEQLVRLLFILAGLVVAMNILGATALIGSVLGAAGVLGLAVGFAMRDTIENYIASILLSLRQPFAPNDAVMIEGVEGRITTLNSRATIITTWDGNEVRIPNAIVYKAMIKNYTHTPERRFDFEIRIALASEISCALAIALHAVRGVDGVLEEPQPACQVNRIDEYAIVLTVLGWVDQRSSDFNKVRSEAIRAVKEAFDAEHVRLAEPVQNYRELPAPREEQDDAPKSRRPTEAEMEAIKDTSVDTTIRQKVEERRQSTANDLLSPAAPRE